MEKYLIIVEGKADAVFIRDYIYFLFKDLKIYDNKGAFDRGKPNTIATEPEIKILNAGGFQNIKNYKTQLISAFSKDYKLIVIYDTDDETKDYGGVKERSKYLENIKKEFTIDFEYFFFPNHKDNGDLETLLLKIIIEEKLLKTIDCQKKYVYCSNKISNNELSNELLDKKSLVFNYFRTFFGMGMAKEENRIFTSEYWDFKNSELDTLNAFLKNFIKDDEK